MSTVAATDSGRSDASPPGVIVARAGRYYRNARYLMAAICLGMGAWFAYDGFVKWPRENQAARARGEEKLPHSEELDLPLQRGLAFACPVLGLFVLVRMFYMSRGEYRLENDVLHVPGHPPVPLDAVRALDKTLWDRKGIARVEYEVPGSGAVGVATLDDFVYDQTATDSIVDRIEAVVAPPADEAAAADAGTIASATAEDDDNARG